MSANYRWYKLEIFKIITEKNYKKFDEVINLIQGH